MALPHSEPARAATGPHARVRAVRVALTRPETKLLSRVVVTLALLVVVGLVVGQVLGHVAAAGIEHLLELVAVD
jgi:hypothetical protein